MFEALGQFAWNAGLILLGAARETIFQIILLAFPFMIAGLALHALERVAQKRLAAKFGWTSLLFTGWLGTPVHEMSHAVACVVFGHKIEEMALFRPDRERGTMGFVRHSWNTSNPWAVMGNFFIGTAPLAGGTAALSVLVWIFFPTVASEALAGPGILEAVVRADMAAAVTGIAGMVFGALGAVFSTENLADWRLWVFLYGVLCVGSHLGPSPADYREARKGVLAALLALLALNVLLLGFGVAPGSAMSFAAGALGPVMALFVVALALNCVAAAGVLAVTAVADLFGKPRPRL